jgi:hypothetical protein
VTSRSRGKHYVTIFAEALSAVKRTATAYQPMPGWGVKSRRLPGYCTVRVTVVESCTEPEVAKIVTV